MEDFLGDFWDDELDFELKVGLLFDGEHDLKNSWGSLLCLFNGLDGGVGVAGLE